MLRQTSRSRLIYQQKQFKKKKKNFFFFLQLQKNPVFFSVFVKFPNKSHLYQSTITQNFLRSRMKTVPVNNVKKRRIRVDFKRRNWWFWSWNNVLFGRLNAFVPFFFLIFLFRFYWKKKFEQNVFFFCCKFFNFVFSKLHGLCSFQYVFIVLYSVFTVLYNSFEIKEEEEKPEKIGNHLQPYAQGRIPASVRTYVYYARRGKQFLLHKSDIKQPQIFSFIFSIKLNQNFFFFFTHFFFFLNIFQLILI